MSSADAPVRLFMPDVAYTWPGLADARARFAWGEPSETDRRVAELDGGGEPSRALTLREFKGHVILPPGEPMLMHNLWLCYPGRRHAVSVKSNTLLFDPGDNPADGICLWLFLAVDSDERPARGLISPPQDRVPLVVDGSEQKTWYYAESGLVCRAALLGHTYFAAICPLGQEGETRLVTQ